VPAKNNVPVQASKILPIISPFYGVNHSVSAVLLIFLVKNNTVSIFHHPCFNTSTDDEQSVVL
jgi:formate-dependent nitrite reductase membrane component NrfD